MAIDNFYLVTIEPEGLGCVREVMPVPDKAINPLRAVRDWGSHVAGSLRNWAKIGHRDWPCPRCGTIVRAGMRECVLCGHEFDI